MACSHLVVFPNFASLFSRKLAVTQAKNELADPAENPDSSRNALTAA